MCISMFVYVCLCVRERLRTGKGAGAERGTEDKVLLGHVRLTLKH